TEGAANRTDVGAVFASLWVSAFVLTSMDTGARVVRFAWEEVLEPLQESMRSLHSVLTNRWVGSALAAGISIALAWGGAYNVLWPAFGGANQMLAAVTLLTAALWVRKTLKVTDKKYIWAVVAPAVFLWFTVLVSLVWYLVAVPSSIMVQAFTVLEIVLVLILMYDYYQATRQTTPIGLGTGI
ncbi:MAG TPA: carbon starvation protein A, partial [Firmicutes bacterium]|nr:carbon starvation protein A [Bacillota bacterium]